MLTRARVVLLVGMGSEYWAPVGSDRSGSESLVGVGVGVLVGTGLSNDG